MRKSGKFITIEGVEGSGKTTQCALLADYLREQGIDVVVTREPGGTRAGEQIRQILLSPSNNALSPIAELMLFLAARAQQVAEIVLPSLESGKCVICDRFSDATIAYQGYGRGLDLDSISQVNEIATQGLKPDLTILLDLDIETGISRAVTHKREFRESKDGDRIEKQDKEFHRRVREGYIELARREPERIVVVPVTGSIKDIHRIVVSLVAPFLVKTP
ncbi:dTMP kinase [Candidatus Poribacteria bacterium]|nr:dTMP kinase [Candidatus Poribacteria bacterium]